jgi:DNA polymerase elongation subunit (family B)
MNNIDKIEKLKQEISVLDQKQKSLKILLNSGYGALANPYFAMYDIRLAKAITYTAQLVTNWVKQHLEKCEHKCIYGDTDSCTGDTKIRSKKYGEIEISEYFDLICGIEEIDKKGSVKHILENDNVCCMINGEILDKKVKYVMKHKVKKKMYKIKTKNNNVIITEDHSVIIKRGNKYVSVKVSEILKTDKIIEIV